MAVRSRHVRRWDSRLSRGRTARVALAASLLAVVAAPAAVAAPLVTLDPTSGPPGTSVSVVGRGFASNGTYRILWDGEAEVARPKADAGGAFRVDIIVPGDAGGGPHVVRTCRLIGCPEPVDVTFLVTAAPTPTAPPRTPAPTLRPSPSPGTTPPAVTPAPTATESPDPTGTGRPAPTAIPTPTLTFPAAAATPAPTPLPAVVVTPGPTPPSGLVASPGPFPDLDIVAVEVTQGIQNLANSMPLVAHRRTYARVHITVEGALELAHTHGVLEARRDGTQIGFIWPENGPITARAGGGNRLALDDSLYFRLPAAWTTGEVELRAVVYSHDPAFIWSKEPAWENNFETVEVTFHEALPIELHLATLHLHRSFHPTDVVREYAAWPDGPAFATPGAITTSTILAGMWRYHPISSLSVDALALHVMPLDHHHGDEWDLGDCSTPIGTNQPPASGGLWLADWRVLMTEPDPDAPRDVPLLADRTTIWVLDSTLTVDTFYIRDDGAAQVFGSWSGPPVDLVGAPAFVDGCPNAGDESGEPNSTLGLHRALYDWSDTREFFVGLVHDTLPTRWGGLASGDNETAWVNMDPGVWTSADWYITGASTFAHEIGHLAGLKHVACKDDDGDGVPDELAGGAIDPTHPQQGRFPECSLAEELEHGFYGFDVYHASFGLATPSVISNDRSAPAANRAYPLLGYKGPKWIDPFHYCRLLGYYGVPCDVATIDEPFDPPGGPLPDGFFEPPDPLEDPLPDPGVPLLLVGGVIDPGTGTSTLEGMLALDDPTEALLERLDRQDELPDEEVVATLVAVGADGRELASVDIADRSSVEERGGPFRYDVLVPLDPATVRFDLLDRDGIHRAALAVPPAAPSARWTSLQPDAAGAVPEVDDEVVIAFEAGDPDGGDPRGTLLYSPDGEHWQLVATDLAPGRHEIDDLAAALPGSGEGRFRLLVSDGVRTTVAGGEPVVRVPNRPPEARIDVPAVPLTVPVGAPVLLAGAGFDLEDRALGDDALEWRSSLDGSLGHGREISADQLSAGRHVIALVASDSAGAEGMASVELTVDPAIVETAPSAELEATIDRVFERYAAGENPGATPPPASLSPNPGPPLGPVAIGLALVVVVAAASTVWIRVSQTRSGAGRASGDITIKGSRINENAPPPPDEDPPVTG